LRYFGVAAGHWAWALFANCLGAPPGVITPMFPLVNVPVLFAFWRRCYPACAASWSAVRAVRAMMVRAGLALPWVGSTLPSVM
jgi:hypothetical protein